jgi:hypothetical protein
VTADGGLTLFDSELEAATAFRARHVMALWEPMKETAGEAARRTGVFCVRPGELRLMLDGEALPHVWNSKGAAEAAIKVEVKRKAR